MVRVLEGIQAARDAGLTPIKINTVVVGGENDHEVNDLVSFFSQWADTTELRFIEYMPFGTRLHTSVSSQELRARLAARWTLEAENPNGHANGPARTWRVIESGLRVGFISALSEHFCATCNRLRLMADGRLRTCLAHEDTPSLRDLLRDGASDDEMKATIRGMVLGKPKGHDCELDGGAVFEGSMMSIGG